MDNLAVAQRKMERIMLGITIRDRKRNTWIRQETGVSGIINAIRKAKHNWAGHIARLSAWLSLDHQSNIVDPKRLDQKIIKEVWALNEVWILTIFMFWWRPSKILVSLKQTLNPCSSEYSTHIAMLSCSLPGDCWMGVTSTIGGDRKRWNDKGKSKPLKIDKRKKQMTQKSKYISGLWPVQKQWHSYRIS